MAFGKVLLMSGKDWIQYMPSSELGSDILSGNPNNQLTTVQHKTPELSWLHDWGGGGGGGGGGMASLPVPVVARLCRKGRNTQQYSSIGQTVFISCSV